MRGQILGLLLSVFLAGGVLAQARDIESTIDRQLQAFSVDDFETAFTFASPNLQRLFQTPSNFQRMVVQGYPMVWRFREVDFLELTERSGALWQRVRIVDAQGMTHILDYRMLETPAGWRINGVQILDAADFSA
jgi:hypothetical protein